MRLDRFPAAALALALASACAAPARGPAPAEDPARAAGERYVAWFHTGQVDSLWAHSDEGLRGRIGGVERLARLRRDYLGIYGWFAGPVRDSIGRSDSTVVFSRTGTSEVSGAIAQVRFTLEPGSLRILRLAAADAGIVAPSPYEGDRTRADLRLPFADEWTVYWGGRTVDENYHAVYPHERFAFDFLPTRDGQFYSGDPSRLESFFCFGRPILAPGAGTVVRALDTVPDNAVGAFHPTSQTGNMLVIDHGADEYSYFAHLRRGSVRVRVGQRVAAGDTIGACGNSGRTTAPHLHYHLMDRPDPGPGARSRPVQFQGYLADGVPVPRGEPRKGQVVRQPR